MLTLTRWLTIIVRELLIEEKVMTAKKTPTPPAPPKTPKTPTKAEKVGTPPKEAKAEIVEELPRKFEVKHKKTGNTFEVNADYYNRNKGILERV